MSYALNLPFSASSIKATQLPGSLRYVDATTGVLHTNSHIGGDASAYDFALPIGTPVVAIATGIVVSSANIVPNDTGNAEGTGWAGTDPYGNFVTIKYDLGGGNTLYATYAHLKQENVLPVDTVVFPGDVVGYVGLTGQTGGAHLHIAFGLQTKAATSSDSDPDGTGPDRADAQGNYDLVTFGSPVGWVLNSTYNEYEYEFSSASSLSAQLGAQVVNQNFVTSGVVGGGFNTPVWDSDDYYSYTATADGVLTITLSELSDDIDLRVLNDEGTRLNQSINTGTTPETIIQAVVAGETYLIHVDPYDYADSDYLFSLNFSGSSPTAPVLTPQDSGVFIHDLHYSFLGDFSHLFYWNQTQGFINDLGLVHDAITLDPLLLADVAIAPDGRLYGISNSQLFLIDETTAQAILVGDLAINDAVAFEIDVYGNAIILGGQSNNVYSVNLRNCSLSAIGDTGSFLAAGDLIAYNGSFYFSSISRHIVEIDPFGGTVISSAYHGIPDVFGLSGAPDGLYAYSRSLIYALDVHTGNNTRLYNLQNLEFFLNVGGAAATNYTQSGMTLRGRPQSDLILGAYLDDILYGFGGDDDIIGQSGKDSLFGGLGSDTIDGGSEQDLIFGEGGRDLLFGGGEADFVHGFASHDTLTGGAGDDDLRGGFGKDLLNGAADDDVARGFEGDDRLFGGGGVDTLLGGDENDSLIGGGGGDRLKGDAGDDSLNGSFGADLVTGGLGDDEFQFRKTHGADTIDDFTPGAATEDVIRLLVFGAAFDSFGEVIAAASDDGTDTTIDFGAGDMLILEGVLVGELDPSDFTFG